MAAAVGQLIQLQTLELDLLGTSLSPGPQICRRLQGQKPPPPSKPAQRRGSEGGAPGPAAGAAHPGEEDRHLKAGAETSSRFFRVFGGRRPWGVSVSCFGRKQHRGWRSEVLGPLCARSGCSSPSLHAGNPAPSAGAPGGIFSGSEPSAVLEHVSAVCGEVGRMQGREGVGEGVWKVSEVRVELRVQASGPRSMQRSSFHFTSPATAGESERSSRSGLRQHERFWSLACSCSP